MENKTFNVEGAVPVVLTEQDIDDIMMSALEGGITYWCCRAEVVEEKRCSDWGHEQISKGGVLVLWDNETDTRHDLNLKKFLEGFKLWLADGGDTYNAVSGGKVDCGRIDSECADCIIQYALFREVIYG